RSAYSYKAAANSRAKQTGTEIQRQREMKDEYRADQMVHSFQAPIIKRPSLMQNEKAVSAAERGTAMHTVMQHVPMKAPMNEREVAEFIEKLVEREILTRLEAD